MSKNFLCVFFFKKFNFCSTSKIGITFQFGISVFDSSSSKKRRKDKMLQFISWLEGANQNKRFFCQEDRDFLNFKIFHSWIDLTEPKDGKTHQVMIFFTKTFLQILWILANRWTKTDDVFRINCVYIMT